MSKKQRKSIILMIIKKSSFKWIIEDMKDTKDVGLKSVPKIRREQVPSTEETSKEILCGMAIVRERAKQKTDDNI
jgi:hypothetical protein